MDPSFGDLPYLVLKKIFRMMPSLREAIRCSLVCRNWREAYEMMVRPQSLCLHLQVFVRLNHRLFHTNERLDSISFLRHPDHSQFLSSEFAMSHFKQIKKLVLFIAYSGYALPAFRLRNQLNHFESLEYVELFCHTVVQEGCEINLPNLKIFWCDYMEFEENAQVILNTPSLEVINLLEYSRKCPEGSEGSEEIANFKFLFPEKLKYLEMYNHKTGFKFDIEFPNLECLVFPGVRHVYVSDQIWNGSGRVRLFGDDFLESLPSLRFLYFSGFRDLDLPVLEEEKRKFNRKDLNICDERLKFDFDYKNWANYLEHRIQLTHWPTAKDFVFNKLIDCEIPLKYFEENYLRVRELRVRQVPDQTLLVDFLRKVRIRFLCLEHDCNLGQSFLEEIASSVPITTLSMDECVLNRLSDLSVLSRLNVFYLEVYFQQLRLEAASVMLRNSTCDWTGFHPYDGLYERKTRSGKIRKEPNTLNYSHRVYKIEKEYYCEACAWISSKDPNRSEDPMEVTLQHIGGLRMRNLSRAEYQQIDRKFEESV